MTVKKNKGVDWEENISELEKIVKEFENGNLNLEESLKKFERGVELYKLCKNALTDAEKRVKVLSDTLKEDDIDLDNFERSDDSDDEDDGDEN